MKLTVEEIRKLRTIKKICVQPKKLSKKSKYLSFLYYIYYFELDRGSAAFLLHLKCRTPHKV